MSEFALVPSQMSTASAAASDAAAAAKGANGSDALASLASALPGTTTAEIAPELGDAWESGIDGWSDNMTAFAASIDAATEEGTGADASAGGFFGGLQGLFGGAVMITYGNLRDWDPEGLTSASTGLRADLNTLEKARDEVEAQTVPDSWVGIARMFATARRAALVGSMDQHLEGVRTFERAIFTAQAQVSAIRTLVVDLDHDARSQEFEIGSDGSVTDVSPTKTFESVRAAEAHTEQRVLLRDALAERVESVVDQAYEVDAALVHARPDGSFSSDGPQGVADPEVERQWDGMSEDERRATLEEMAETLADDYGLDDFEIRYEDLEDEDGDGDDDEPETNSHGSWSDDDRVLRIDVNDLDDPAIINTMAHEVRHAGQHENVRDAFPGRVDQVLIDAGLKDDPFDPPPGVDRDQVEDWRDNFDDYQRAEDDFDDYWNQPVEADARETGEEYLDDLTGEDLEEHREAAG